MVQNEDGRTKNCKLKRRNQMHTLTVNSNKKANNKVIRSCENLDCRFFQGGNQRNNRGSQR